MGVSSSVLLLGPYPISLEVWVGSLPCGIGPHMSRLRHLGWNQCSHGLSSRPLESCHHQCRLGAVYGVLGYPEGSAAELLDGSFEAPVLYNRFQQAIFPLGFAKVGVDGLVMGE